MNTVLYSKDLEPITVLDMPLWLQEAIENSGLGKITVKSKNQDPETQPPTITVEVQYLRDEKTGNLYKFFTTKDEELTLGVVPSYLPGQVQMHQYMVKVIQKQRDLLNKLR